MQKIVNVIYVAKNKSPLLVGVGEDFNVVASDAMAMLTSNRSICRTNG